MSTLDRSGLPEPLAELLRQLPLMPLGPGKPDPAMRAKLAAAERDLSPACQAGLWLAFDFLDESHAISQELETAEGSYWHAIMHRREPDADNSKYWWRKVGSHPVLKLLQEQAPSLGYKFTDPFVLVDFVEHVRDTGSTDEELAKRVQQLEWQLLFEHCYRGVIS
jgi:hypothetical protein